MFDIRQVVEQNRLQAHALGAQYVNPSFAKVLEVIGFDVNYARGQGQYLWDDKEQRYLDCLSGYGTFACGRNHPVIRKALQDAMDLDLPNLTKMGMPRLSGLLARRLCELAPGKFDRVFFSNSGAEAVETAIKFARAATRRDRVLCCEKGFHGLTMGALSVNGNDEFRSGFGRLLEPVTAVPFNDLEALERELRRGDVAALVIEPIQGKGVNIPDDRYLPEAAAMCRRHGALFVADEVQTGLGRTGRWFAVQHWGVEPDILCCAKALSGGFVPVAATLTRDEIHRATFSSLDRCVVHSTTFGQNDMAMVAGLATLAVMEDQKIVENAAAIGDRLRDRLASTLGKYELVKEVRGKGLMVAVEYGPPRSLALRAGWTMIHAADKGLFPQAILIPLLQDHHILAQVAGHHIDVIKLIPPLIIHEQDVEQIVTAFDEVTARCHKFPGPVWEIGKRLTKHVVKKHEVLT
jgi:ornithine--oxo-acid transaminase